MSSRVPWLWLAVFSALVLACTPTKRRETPRDTTLADSPEARLRIEAVRTRFTLLAPGIATRFDAIDSTHARAVVPADAKRAVLKTARVALPMRAGGEVQLEDDSSHVSVKFHLQGTDDTVLAVADGIALYNNGLAGSDVLHRPNAEGPVVRPEPAN